MIARRIFVRNLGASMLAALGVGAVADGADGADVPHAPPSPEFTPPLGLGPDDTLVLSLPQGTYLSADQFERIGVAARAGFRHDHVVVLEGGIKLDVVHKGRGRVAAALPLEAHVQDNVDEDTLCAGILTLYDAFGFPLARSHVERWAGGRMRGVTDVRFLAHGEPAVAVLETNTETPFGAPLALRRWNLGPVLEKHAKGFVGQPGDVLLIEWLPWGL